jgi:uncharacterized membrane protein
MQMDDVMSKPIARLRPLVAWRDFPFIFGGALLLAGLFSLDMQGGPLGLLRIVVGLAYVLYVPGYCLVAAIFPADADLDRPARQGASIGLSVALVPALALLLDQLPWGIRPVPILASELGVIVFCTAIAIWRRAHNPTSTSAPLPIWQPHAWWDAPARGTRRIVGATSTVLLLFTLAGAWMVSQAGVAAYTTEFYILGAEGQAQDYPRAAEANGTLAVTLGLVNSEQSTQHYRVEVWALDSQQPAARTRVAQAGPLVLAAGQKVEQPLSWRLPALGAADEVELLLFIENTPQPYRTLRLWLNPVIDASARH